MAKKKQDQPAEGFVDDPAADAERKPSPDAPPPPSERDDAPDAPATVATQEYVPDLTGGAPVDTSEDAGPQLVAPGGEVPDDDPPQPKNEPGEGPAPLVAEAPEPQPGPLEHPLQQPPRAQEQLPLHQRDGYVPPPEDGAPPPRIPGDQELPSA